jgi:hypothetical protein
MRNYLLGTLEVDRRAAMEERILSDPQFYEDLLVNEEELIDQYLGNNLSPSERQQFETNFLVTAERQNNLRFGRLLRRYLDSQPAPVSSKEIPVAVRHHETHAPAKTFPPLVGGMFGRPGAAAISAAAVAAVGLIVLVCWNLSRKAPQHIAQQDPSSLVKVVPLTPGTLRSTDAVTQHVPLPPKGVRVRLEMEVSNSNFHNYKSELLRENDSVTTANQLQSEKKGEQHIVPWTIGGEVLSPGDYQVRLSGVLDSGQNEFIDNYTFRVVK